MNEPHWTAYVAAVTTPLVAVLGAFIAGYIGYRNWRTAQNKLKMELFDRRMAVYADVQDSIARRFSGHWDPETDLDVYLRRISPARWLFHPPVFDYLRGELFATLERLQNINWELAKPETDGEAKRRLMEERKSTRRWLREQPTEIDKRFAPYLMLEH